MTRRTCSVTVFNLQLLLWDSIEANPLCVSAHPQCRNIYSYVHVRDFVRCTLYRQLTRIFFNSLTYMKAQNILLLYVTHFYIFERWFLPRYASMHSAQQGALRGIHAHRNFAAPLHCKKHSDLPVPCRDVTNQTLPGQEKLNYYRPGRVWLVTSQLGTGKSLTIFTVYASDFTNSLCLHFPSSEINDIQRKSAKIPVLGKIREPIKKTAIYTAEIFKVFGSYL
jgi:hypothetical protein